MADEDGVKYAERPDSLRQLRACKSCKLVKTFTQVCYKEYCIFN